MAHLSGAKLRRLPHMKLRQCLAPLLAALLMTAAPAGAVERIAAVVNDRIISNYDIRQRVIFVIRSTNLEDTPDIRRRLVPQVLRKLIDEALQIDEAERRNVQVSEQDLRSAYAQIETRIGIGNGEIQTFIEGQGIDFQVFREKTRAEVAWSKLVNIRLRPQVQVSDDEVDDLLAQLKAAAGNPEYQYSEIFLQIDQVGESERVRLQAERLRGQILSDADFAEAARQFSAGVSAPQGGAVGWLQQSQIDESLVQAIQTMEPGELSDPIVTTDGVYLILLRDKRETLASDTLDTRVLLKQIQLPFKPDAGEAVKKAARGKASEIAEQANACRDTEAIAKKFNTGEPVDLGELRYRDVPENIRAAISTTEVGQFSKPIEIEDMVMVLAVCNRTAPPTRDIDAVQVRNRLANQRLARLADRYLRDLRQAAIVEIRR